MNTNQQEKKQNNEEYISFFELIFEMIKVLILALIIIIPVRVFLFQPFFIEGSSMDPNFHDGQYLVVSEFGYKQTKISEKTLIKPFKSIVRQDVIVFRYPRNPSQFFIKRVIGLPGESVEVKQGKIYIYNEEHPEGFILDEKAYIGNNILTQDMSRRDVKQDEYYVMGDNRMNSSDSRIFGPINKDKVIGRVLLRVWPTSEFTLY